MHLRFKNRQEVIVASGERLERFIANVGVVVNHTPTGHAPVPLAEVFSKVRSMLSPIRDIQSYILTPADGKGEEQVLWDGGDDPYLCVLWKKIKTITVSTRKLRGPTGDYRAVNPRAKGGGLLQQSGTILAVGSDDDKFQAMVSSGRANQNVEGFYVRFDGNVIRHGLGGG